MNTRYIVKCFKCLQSYEDANYIDAYKDSLIRRLVSDSKAGRIIRCCPYCDDILTTIVSIPQVSNKWSNFKNKR